jgi:nicotinamidase-related amidase
MLLVDVINHFEFPQGDCLLGNALRIAPALSRLKRRARQAGIPTLYVNDNFGQWRSNFSRLLDYCLRPSAPGKEFVEQLRPDDEDYLVLKPMHSAFYQSPLDTLLRRLGARTLILTGLASNSCIVCTAHDANMREFRLFVPSDCCAARTEHEHRQAIEHIGAMTSGDVRRSTELDLEQIARG